MAFITINKENFYHNLNQIALKTGSIDKIAIVLKDNAYGHGLEHMAKLAYDFGVRHTVVRNRKEADQVVSLFDTVLILGERGIASGTYSFAINSLQDIALMEQGSRVELKVDTGMHRNGIAMDEIPEALALIKKYSLVLTGLMTHFRSADKLGSELFWQQKQFEKVKAIVAEAGFKNFRVHSYNSAATLRMKHFNEDLVRVGIAAYGYNELAAGFDETNLKPVLALHARRISARQLKKGDRIGYAGDFTVTDGMLVSTYDLGYGDGWPRGDTRHPYLTAEGSSILGRVSMDFIALESDKDEVCIMNDAQKAAKHFGTISYEMTTALSPDIERTVI